MADFISAKIVGDTKTVAIFDTLPERFNERFLDRLTALTDKLEQLVESNLSSAVGRKTGELDGSIRSGVSQNKNFIKGRVWSLAGAKAVALEYGAHGTGEVRAHTRRVTSVFGRKLAAPLEQMVAAYTRTQNIAAHPFMRPAKAAIEPEFNEAFQATMDELAAQATASLS